MSTTTTKRGTSMKDAAKQILEDAGEPLHADEITRRALEDRGVKTSGKTPAATMNAQLSVDAKKGKEATFVRTAPGTFGLAGRDKPMRKRSRKARGRGQGSKAKATA